MKKNKTPIIISCAVLAVIIMILGIVFISSCLGNMNYMDYSDVEVTQHETAIDTTPEPEPIIEPEVVYNESTNPLTGLPTEEDITDNKPYAIVIGNSKTAIPQIGISKADIICEVVAEGGITRMLALYQDISKVGTIGSIRSSQTYLIDIAQGYDALLFFAGGNPDAYSMLSDRDDITYFDGLGSMRAEIFYIDQQRRDSMGYEHSMVTSGELIVQRLPTYNTRLEHAEGYKSELSFVEDGTPEDGITAVDFIVTFEDSSKTTSFKYDTGDQLYYLSQHGSEYRDDDDNTQVAVTNVLILKTSISDIPGDPSGRLDIKTTGHGSGYFICGGKYVEIDWLRTDYNSQFQYSLKDGSDLNLGQGKTYVCIVSHSVEINLE